MRWFRDLLAVPGNLRKLREWTMSPEFQGLVDDVTATRGVAESAVALIKGLDAKLANVTSEDDIKKLRSSLREATDPLSQALAENSGVNSATVMPNDPVRGADFDAPNNPAVEKPPLASGVGVGSNDPQTISGSTGQTNPL